ncbi:Cell division control protein [Lachnellula suecica]|uniref:Cell division control protein n=1 Tax=Lachnellula suecica TaxID=602035 RepID=A0A8T9BW80_9HELO|nr:Cell division control protein [Lachnellula suecica]
MVSTSRPRTPSAGMSPPPNKLAPVSETEKSHPPRRSSLGLLLRRSKSTEFRGKGSKKQQALAAQEQELQRQRDAIPRSPPRLPNLSATPQIESFGGEDHRPDSVAIISGKLGQYQGRHSMEPGRSSAATGSVPIPPIPNSARNGDWVDPYARTESMTHRGRYSYASSAVSTINSPRRVRRRKDPTPFNILIIGARSSGKTSFLNFLKTSLALPAKKRGARPTELAEDIFAPQGQKSGNFISHYLETEIDGERIGLTLWDSEGMEKNVVDLQLREVSSFLEAKFEETFTEEMKVVRAPGVQDTHIHCTFLILDPVRIDRNIAASQNVTSNGNGTNGKYGPAPRIIGGLDEDLDLQVLRTLQGKTTVVPVISKADTITTAHMAYLKKTVWDSLRQANLDPLEALGLDDVEGEGSSRDSRIEEGDEEDSDYEVKAAADEPAEPTISTPEQSASPSSKRLSSGSVRRHKATDSESETSSTAPYLPLSIISPDIYEPSVIGRKFPWGFADPMNTEHCDFVRLKEAVFSEWRGELREASRELWYEGWRTSRLKHRDVKPGPRR